MKIVYFVHQFFPLHFTGGTERYTLEVAKSVAERGHDVQIVTYQYSDKAQRLKTGVYDFEYENLPVREIYSSPPVLPKRLKTEYRTFNLLPYLEKTMEDFKPDVVHVMHCLNFSGYLLLFLASKKIQTIITLTDYWFLCRQIQLIKPNGEICPGPNGTGDCLKCAFHTFIYRFLKLNSYPVTKSIPCFFFNCIANLINYDRIDYMKSALESVNVIVAPTPFCKEIFERNGFNTQKFLVSPYGIDTSWKVNKSLHLSDKIRIGYIGGLAKQKGVHILVDAFSHIASKNLELLIYGGAYDKVYYEHLVKLASGDSRIKFLGTFHIKEMGRVLSEMDALCVPSLWNDYPLVIYSAFAMNVPVIASDIESLKGIMIDNVNGLLFTRGDISSLGSILTRISKEPYILEALSKNISKVKTIDDNTEELLEIYQSLIKSS
jgi:glycosyltransferase involved in cell wall biosynthesis